MTATSFHLTDQAAARVAQVVKAGRYSDGSAYVRELIQRDAAQAEADEWLSRVIAEGRTSGKAMEMTPAQMGEAMQTSIDRVARKKATR